MERHPGASLSQEQQQEQRRQRQCERQPQPQPQQRAIPHRLSAPPQVVGESCLPVAQSSYAAPQSSYAAPGVAAGPSALPLEPILLPVPPLAAFASPSSPYAAGFAIGPPSAVGLGGSVHGLPFRIAERGVELRHSPGHAAESAKRKRKSRQFEGGEGVEGGEGAYSAEGADGAYGGEGGEGDGYEEDEAALPTASASVVGAEGCSLSLAQEAEALHVAAESGLSHEEESEAFAGIEPLAMSEMSSMGGGRQELYAQGVSGQELSELGRQSMGSVGMSVGVSEPMGDGEAEEEPLLAQADVAHAEIPEAMAVVSSTPLTA